MQDFGSPELNRELNYLAAVMDTSPSQLWWMSFCDTERPAGTQFLGVSIVEAPNEVMAASEAWNQGCNPGGHVRLFPIPQEMIDFHLDEGVDIYTLTNKLMSKEELQGYGLA